MFTGKRRYLTPSVNRPNGLTSSCRSRRRHILRLKRRDISKSKWPGYAEGLARHGIGLVDKDGRGWRTRLRVA
ncbi:hypothetical protein EXIGLDRAFT_283754 [Exidia glandulosa HHB12029]|uniref:Uncharacterized protein n=1 Tax=Exidia glandulosa HHB12029 TaxID=1314781 RepID=A0A165DH94_EXIGL|nr:hypothetical protein EXIGLDRAFT_283754 [Exidia glandulosa HHB12029]